MKKIPKKKRKVTELYFNEYDGTAEIYTYNTKLKKRLTAFAATYPGLCQLTEDDENGGLRFEIDKHRIGIRLTSPAPRRILCKRISTNSRISRYQCA